jgi:EccD-like transmembrane domain
LLVAGIVLAVLPAVSAMFLLPATVRAPAGLAVVLVLVALVVAAGTVYSRRRPSPYLGRIGDILDTVLIIAVVPLACAVLGLYEYARGLAG